MPRKTIIYIFRKIGRVSLQTNRQNSWKMDVNSDVPLRSYIEHY
jgi:hypothetical protein